MLAQHAAHIASSLDPRAEGQVLLPHHKEETEAREAGTYLRRPHCKSSWTHWGWPPYRDTSYTSQYPGELHIRDTWGQPTPHGVPTSSPGGQENGRRGWPGPQHAQPERSPYSRPGLARARRPPSTTSCPAGGSECWAGLHLVPEPGGVRVGRLPEHEWKLGQARWGENSKRDSRARKGDLVQL